jgi:magnesium transporter
LWFPQKMRHLCIGADKDMSDNEETKYADEHKSHTVQDILTEVVELLRNHKLVESLQHTQELSRHKLVESLAHNQNMLALRERLDELHPADVANILEALPLEERLIVWDLIKAERDGEILLEVSDAVRESLIANMDSGELLAAAETLDTDEIADLAPDLPHDVVQDILESLDAQNRARLQSVMSYPEDTVGALMDFDMVTVRADITLEVAQRYLRRLGGLPDQTDKLFVVDRDDALVGVLPLKRLLINEPEMEVSAAMIADPVTLHPEDAASDAAKAFERYDLVSVPVVMSDNRLVGRMTVDAVVDFIREESDSDMLNLAGLREEEDLFSSVGKSVRNRWTWLAVNLVTAFIASRVIGLFEGSIEKLVALAALMPIVAGIGGNSGNQTITMIVRALALGQIHPSSARRLFTKEIGVSLLNGLLWGSAIGLVAYWLYHNFALSFVMTCAVTLNLLLAAVMGVSIPIVMHKLGRDPAVGSSVLITAVTDSGGFFIFLGLATIFLL